MKKDNRNNRGKYQSPDEKLSKMLSFVLRHGAVDEGLKIRPDGYVSMDEIFEYLNKKGYKDVTMKRI